MQLLVLRYVCIYPGCYPVDLGTSTGIALYYDRSSVISLSDPYAIILFALLLPPATGKNQERTAIRI